LIWCGGSAIISNNTITGGGSEVELDGAFDYGLNTGAVTVANNTINSVLSIDNYSGGINIDNDCSGRINILNNLLGQIIVGINDEANIQNNTILNQIYLQTNKSTILYNNILHQDSKYALYDAVGDGVNASYNWWGTTELRLLRGLYATRTLHSSLMFRS
jgi:hypothetical protein